MPTQALENLRRDLLEHQEYTDTQKITTAWNAIIDLIDDPLDMETNALEDLKTELVKILQEAGGDEAFITSIEETINQKKLLCIETNEKIARRIWASADPTNDAELDADLEKIGEDFYTEFDAIPILNHVAD